VHNYAGVSSPLGLATVLAGISTAEAAISRSDTPGLDLMLAGPMPSSPAALLSGSALKSLLKSLRSRYDVIIIDAPPVFGLADAPRIAAAVQRTIFIVEAGRAKVPDIRGALRRLFEFDGTLAGLVLTKFEAARSTSPSNLYVYDYGQRPLKQLQAVEVQ
jgi:Mrp family chromosome partitioning ATPase